MLHRSEQIGVALGWNPGYRCRVVSELTAHPAMLGLREHARIVKYNKGPVHARRKHFTQLLQVINYAERTKFPVSSFDTTSRRLLRTHWKKPP